jgi:hypothetical protein
VWNINENQRRLFAGNKYISSPVGRGKNDCQFFVESFLIYNIHICIIDKLLKNRRSKASSSNAGNILERRREKYKEFQR